MIPRAVTIRVVHSGTTSIVEPDHSLVESLRLGS